MVFNLKLINPFIIISVLLAVPNARASFQPLLGTELNNKSLYASGYITMGAGSSIGGNVQSAAAVVLGADATVQGNVEAGTAATLGANAGVDGYIRGTKTVTLGASANVDGSIEAGTTATVGANAKVNGDVSAGTTATMGAAVEVKGDVLSGTTVTVGAGSILDGNVDAGSTTTIGAGAKIDGLINAGSLKIASAVPEIANQEELVTSVQATLKDLGTGTELISDTFGTDDEILEAGIYSTINYLSIAINKTITLDGKGVDGSWVFNIPNYLMFAAGAKVILKDVTDNSSIIWNVLGDKLGSAGFTQLGVGAEVRGHIFSKGFVQTGANALIAGIGDDCGGAFSATNFIEFGADSILGTEGCTNGIVVSVADPTSIWLMGFGLFGLVVISRRK